MSKSEPLRALEAANMSNELKVMRSKIKESRRRSIFSGEHEHGAEGNEEQDQGEQEEIHGVYDFLKIFSSNINFVYSI